MNDLERFLNKVERIPEVSCWVWNGATKPNGYGNFYMFGKTYQSHRASWILFHGDIEESLLVLHKCDFPSCVNPHHLFLGSQKENMQDMIKKNRKGFYDNHGERNPMFGKSHSYKTKILMSQIKKDIYSGSKHPRATINEQIAKEIFDLKGIMTAKQISESMSVSVHVVGNIWSKKSWLR